MAKLFVARFIAFILVYLLNCAHCAQIRECENEYMSLDPGCLLDGRHKNVYFYTFPGAKANNFSVRRTLNLELGPEWQQVRLDDQERFKWGLTLTNGWMLENMPSTLSMLVPNGMGANDFARYQILKSECSQQNRPMETNNKTIRNANKNEQAILSFLHMFCEFEAKTTANVVFVQRDVDLLIALNLDRDELVYTMTPRKVNGGFRNESYIYWKKQQGSKAQKLTVKVRQNHEFSVKPIKLPSSVKQFLVGVGAITYVQIDGQAYEFITNEGVTLIYKGGESYLTSVVKAVMDGKAGVDMPRPVDYFPNNYWFGCKVEFCKFESMDMIMNLDLSEKELNLRLIRDSYYHSLSSRSTTVGQLQRLTVDSGGHLDDFLTSLITPESRSKLNKRLYEEFVNLKYVEAGSYFALNETSTLFFVVKDRMIYSLLTVKRGKSVKQQLQSAKLGKLSLFGSSMGKSRVQAAFTRPNQRLVLIMEDFLLHYSFSNFTRNGSMTEIQESFEIPNTFEHITAAITLRNYTYIFTRRHYQVHPLNPVENFASDKFQPTSKLLICPAGSPGVHYDPALVSYSDSQHRPVTKKNLISSTTPPSKGANTILQIVLLITVGAFIMFFTVALYVKKFQKTIFVAHATHKEKDKTSVSGSSGYLSTAFNLAKSSSEKMTKEAPKESVVVLKELVVVPKLDDLETGLNGDQLKSDGLKNLQPKELSNRTASLKQLKAKIQSQPSVSKKGSLKNQKASSRQTSLANSVGPSKQGNMVSKVISKRKSRKSASNTAAESDRLLAAKHLSSNTKRSSKLKRPKD